MEENLGKRIDKLPPESTAPVMLTGEQIQARHQYEQQKHQPAETVGKPTIWDTALKSQVRRHDDQHRNYNTPRAAILEEAMKIVHHDRNANYGNPEDNFNQIAQLWTAYKKVKFTAADVAVMNMLIKIARLANNPNHHDSAVDIAGYAACLGDIQASSRTQNPAACSTASGQCSS